MSDMTPRIRVPRITTSMVLHHVTSVGSRTRRSDVLDAAQVVQRSLTDVGIAATLRRQSMVRIWRPRAGKFEGLVSAPFTLAWEPHTPL